LIYTVTILNNGIKPSGSDSLLPNKYERDGLRVFAKDRSPHGCGVRAPMDGFTACLWQKLAIHVSVSVHEAETIDGTAVGSDHEPLSEA